ncbi:tyrosine-type recombinase/integrase [Sphaerimonospora mesophila]|uniref:tyrosine-type recombinase/integrase n=1 Tax=Sphaerimonospora mesophila TaxID=37483 RepID=UPI0009F93C75
MPGRRAGDGPRCGGALRRRLDLNAGTVSVRQQHAELDTGELLVGPPKSRAGLRTVAIPEAIIPALRQHLARFTGPEPTSLVFTGANGGILRRSNFRRAVEWEKTTKKLGVPGLHFHDLRHTGNTIAASAGASLRDLMTQMGHASVRAAMIYQHRVAEADHKTADAMETRSHKSYQLRRALTERCSDRVRSGPCPVFAGRRLVVGGTGFEPVTPRL